MTKAKKLAPLGGNKASYLVVHSIYGSIWSQANSQKSTRGLHTLIPQLITGG